VDTQILEVLRAALSPFPSPMTSSTSPLATSMESLSLSSHSTVATTSTYRVIGRGTAGTIYPSTPRSALKVGRDQKALWNDICFGKEVYDALRASRVVLGNYFHDLTVSRVPSLQFSITLAYVQQWWANSESQFSREDLEEEGKFVFGLDRIPPVPGIAIDALLRAYFPDASDRAALLQAEGHACLIRPYLGRRRTAREKRDGEESQWNLPLFLDQLLSILGLSGVRHMAREMAIGLAVLHWGALVDGIDVEFVFGSTSDSKSSTFNPNGGKRATQLWLLDFDKAEKSELPQNGKEGFGETEMCRRIVTAVTANDPHFPTPDVRGNSGARCDEGGCVEKHIWEVFGETYVAASRILITRNKDITKTMDLSVKDKTSEVWPKEFVRMWKARFTEIREGEDGGFVVFG